MSKLFPDDFLCGNSGNKAMNSAMYTQTWPKVTEDSSELATRQLNQYQDSFPVNLSLLDTFY